MALSVNSWHYIRLMAHGREWPAWPPGPEGAPRAPSRPWPWAMTHGPCYVSKIGFEVFWLFNTCKLCAPNWSEYHWLPLHAGKEKKHWGKQWGPIGLKNTNNLQKPRHSFTVEAVFFKLTSYVVWWFWSFPWTRIDRLWAIHMWPCGTRPARHLAKILKTMVV